MAKTHKAKRTRDEFERVMLPHLAAAHNLALWLLRHAPDSEDAVQESFLKAYKGFDGWSGDTAAAWLLKIVRNTCMTRLKQRSRQTNVVHLDAMTNEYESKGSVAAAVLRDESPLPDACAIASAEHEIVRRAVLKLPTDYREVIVLREFEELSYKEIADITGVPIGTVMSRLSRARHQLRDQLTRIAQGGCANEM